MADDTPKPAGTDPLADELLSMGAISDASDPSHAPAPAEPAAPKPAASSTPGPAQAVEQVSNDLMELEALLQQANFESPGGGTAQDDPAADLLAAAMSSAPQRPAPTTSSVDLPNLQQVVSDAAASSIDLLRDVELNVKIELGRSRMVVEDVLKLAEGSVVELDKLAGDPVDVYVNDRLVARGEVLVLNDNFCVRVNEIVASIREEG